MEQQTRMLSLGLPAAPAFLLASLVGFAASAYIFFTVKPLPPGGQRFAASLPVLALFAVLPRLLDPSQNTIACCTLWAVFAWVAPFRLLSFCWAEGVLTEPFANRDLLHFYACLSTPIHVRHAGWKPRRERRKDARIDDGRSVFQWLAREADSDAWPVLIARSGFKCLCLVAICRAYDYEDRLHVVALQALQILVIFLVISLICDALAAVMQLLLGMPVEPHFDQPYLASSLEDFWSRRWNLLISGLLRDTIYLPVLRLLTSQNATSASAALSNGKANGGAALNGLEHAKGTDNPNHASEKEIEEECAPMQNGVQETLRHRAGTTHSTPSGVPVAGVKPPPAPLWARLAAMFTSFLVSGIMHEIMVFYLSGSATGEMLAFFALHGAATALEGAVKALARGRVALPRVLAVGLTVGFSFVTGQWLFFSPLVSLGVYQQALKNVQAVFGP